MSTFHRLVHNKLSTEEYADFLTLWNKSPTIVKQCKLKTMLQNPQEFNRASTCLLLMLPWEFMSGLEIFNWREVVSNVDKRSCCKLQVIQGGK